MARLRQNLRGFKLPRKALNNRHLYVLLFTLTLWLLVSISAVPSYSQTPTPRTVPSYSQTPTPNPRTVIRELAKSDVENDIPRRNDYAVKRYGKEFPGLKENEILQIYDDEYTKLAEAKKNNLWEQLKPGTGWSVAIVLFFALIFKDTLTKWVSSFFEAVGNQIYGKLSGIQLLQGVALKRYKEELKHKYEKLKISFRPDRPLNLKDIYVPLKVTGGSDRELIDAFQAITKHRRLMVKGSPGSGKTMLLKHIALCYADGRWSTVFNKFQCIPILLELHRLSSSEKTIQEHLEDAFDRDGFPNAKHFVSESLDKGRLLLLFDGLDEVNSDSRERVVNQIKNLLDKYLKCPVIITCRTAVYRGEFDEPVEKTLEVAEFNDQQIRDFLVSWQEDMPEGKSVEQLMQTLHYLPRIMDLARNPLMLTIIAYLYADTEAELPRSRAEFYRKATDVLLEQWHQERNQFQARDKKSILQHLALFFQDNANQQGQDRRSVDYRTVELEVTKILPNLNLQPDCTRSILSEIIERNGLLLKIDGGDRYQFAHLTLQEFFAASQLRDDADGLISRFKADPDAWRETLKLWCGLAGDSTNLIREVRSVDPVVAFECLADAQEVDPTLASEIINSFKSQLGVDGNENIVNHAFASVAADDRRRTDVFTFLKETLENTSETDTRRKAAVNVLSLTNLPSAATLLTKQYVNLDNIEFRQVLDQSLIRMGDIAVPEIKKAVNNDSINQVMDALVGIGTPSALQALVNWLWDKDENRALRAALLLACLIKEEKYQAVLGSIKPPKSQEWKSFEWIVNLYHPKNLKIIGGQIAYCISRKLEDSVEVVDQLYIQDFARELLIPICFIQAIGQLDLTIPQLDMNFIEYEMFLQKVCGKYVSTIWGFLMNNISPFAFIFIFRIFQNRLVMNELRYLKNEWEGRYWWKLEVGVSKKKVNILSIFKKPEKKEILNTIFNVFEREFGEAKSNKVVRVEVWHTKYIVGGLLDGNNGDGFAVSRWVEFNAQVVTAAITAHQKEWKGKIIINKKLAHPHKI
ncbi:NACHT domain-containing protein [Nostoc muscorum FACHB-395]|nr:NACHT domain-containing protein [Desmonostoc muscorum FACHB-395]